MLLSDCDGVRVQFMRKGMLGGREALTAERGLSLPFIAFFRVLCRRELAQGGSRLENVPRLPEPVVRAFRHAPTVA